MDFQNKLQVSTLASIFAPSFKQTELVPLTSKHKKLIMSIFNNFNDFQRANAHYSKIEGFPKWDVEKANLAGYWCNRAFNVDSRNNVAKRAGVAWRAMNMTNEQADQLLAAARKKYVDGGSHVWRMAMCPGFEISDLRDQFEIDELKCLLYW